MATGRYQERDHPPWWIKISLAAGATATLAYSAWVVIGVRISWSVGAISSLGLALLYGLASTYSLRNSRNKRLGKRIRSFWLLIGLGVGSMAISELIWVIYASFHLQPLPFLTDILFLLYYPLVLAGLLRLPYASMERYQGTLFWLDIWIVTISSVMLFWVATLNHLVALVSQDRSAILIVIYPLMDVLLFAGVAALIQRDVEQVPRRVLMFLTTGLGLIASADGLFVYCRLNLLDWALPYLYVLWLMGALCIAGAAGLQSIDRAAAKDGGELKTFLPILRLVLPYFAVGLGWLILIILTFNIAAMELRLQGVLFGALILAILVLLRQYTVLRENMRLYTRMEHLALTDSLTGLYNRHFFNEVLDREVGHSERYQRPLSLLLMDVDDFKAVNDTYGHLQGDVVLKMVAEALSENLRQSDVLARFGGDEFVVILPETDIEGAHAVAEKICAAVARRSYVGQPLGISIGVGIFQAGQTPEQLIEMADRNLYREKVAHQKARTQANSAPL
ncbi:MAG: GGDEF domain-containing protein [Anaerolineales bacterium]|nr:GGDEF domain-containing protein [Anaerolineales bacterium]